MARDLYCWRCDRVIPMLEEHEWAVVEPLLRNGVYEIKQYRQENDVSLSEAIDQGAGRAGLDKYRELTGFDETNSDALWHHRLSLYGPPCVSCGKPLRTPRAGFCAACGTVRPDASQTEAGHNPRPETYQLPAGGLVSNVTASPAIFCFSCGRPVDARAVVCPGCGVQQRRVGQKSRIAAALLAFFLGGFGIHKFYLGRVVWGFLYLLFFWTFIPALVSFVECIVYLCMSDESFAAKYG